MSLQIIAHRGASHWAPESTEPSYRLARELGADWLELDVQRSKDGVLVVFHDDHLGRTTDVAKKFPNRTQEPLGAFTYEELQQLDCGSWFNRHHPHRARPSYAGLKVLTLAEVSSLAQGHRLYLETKAAHLYPGIEKQIVDQLGPAWTEPAADGPRLIFPSFQPYRKGGV